MDDAGWLQLTGCRVAWRGRRVVGTAGEVRLTRREAQLLAYLVARAGQVVSREELLGQIWGLGRSASSRVADATMGRLRAKVEIDRETPDHLLTVHGVGYVFTGHGAHRRGGF